MAAPDLGIAGTLAAPVATESRGKRRGRPGVFPPPGAGHSSGNLRHDRCRADGASPFDNGARWSSAASFGDAVAGGASGFGPLNLAYVRRAAWLALDTHVREAVAYELAGRGCYSVTGDMSAARTMDATAEGK